MKNYTLFAVLTSFTVFLNSSFAEDHGHPTTMPSAPADHEMFNPPASQTTEGTVTEVIDMSAAGYTYFQVEKAGKQAWVAGTNHQIKKGDKVRYDENVVMSNFHSRGLNRTFDSIVFASSVSVISK